MKIIKVIDPDFLSTLDKSNNIIICVPPVDEEFIKESEDFPDTFELCLSRDINLSTDDVVKMGISAFATTIRPRLKISMPAGIKLQFPEISRKHNDNVFWKTYRSFELNNVYNEDNTSLRHILTNFEFVTYIDAVRLRETGHSMILNKGIKFTEFNFSWYVQTTLSVAIENIYLIIDQHVFEEFINIF